MALNVATRANLERKAAWADHVQLHDGQPLPSWIDLSLTELCNRSAGSKNACVFCPRIDSSVYPNQKLHMSVALARKLAGELFDLEYEGAIVLCGFGEPMLHPKLEEIIAAFESIHVELVTNGDFLTAVRIRQLVDAGLDFCAVSLYDGPEQIARFDAMFRAAGCDDSQFILRDRWYGPGDDYGLKLTNRAGTIEVGNQPEIDATRACYYPSYMMQIDWNGDALLCCQDWFKRVRFGNINTESLLSIWRGTMMHKRRMRLLAGRRVDAPCSSCNAEGTLHGASHADGWRAG